MDDPHHCRKNPPQPGRSRAVRVRAVADGLEQCAENEGSALAEHKALREQLREATEGLNQATTPFAGRRMDARVRQALAGQRLDTLAGAVAAAPSPAHA